MNALVDGPVAQPRVHLRAWKHEDLPVYREWLRPHQDWHQWDGPYFPRPTDADADAMITRLTEIIAENAGIPQAEERLPPSRLVIADSNDDTFYGTVSWHWESRETDWARMGITVFDPALRGLGIGRAALGLWTDYLFAHTNWVRLDYSTWSGNVAMLTVGRRLGFIEEARFRKARVVRGEFFDSVVMGVLREEWETRA